MTDPKDRWIVPKPGKLVCTPLKHRTTNGLQFWYDYHTRRIVTENPEISLNFVRSGDLGSEMRIFLKMPNFSIQIGQRDGAPFPAIVGGAPGDETVWEIGSLGAPLYFNTLSNTYTVHYLAGISSRLQSVATDRYFASKEHQETAIGIITEGLQKYDGEWIGACRGEEQSAHVIIAPELAGQLARGAFLN